MRLNINRNNWRQITSTNRSYTEPTTNCNVTAVSYGHTHYAGFSFFCNERFEERIMRFHYTKAQQDIIYVIVFIAAKLNHAKLFIKQLNKTKRKAVILNYYCKAI